MMAKGKVFHSLLLPSLGSISNFGLDIKGNGQHYEGGKILQSNRQNVPIKPLQRSRHPETG